MKFASAQTSPIDKDFDYNLKQHIQLIELAAKNKVDLIVFPEMSLTGYLRKDAVENVFSVADKRLEPLLEKAKEFSMILVVGAPVLIVEKLFIGAFIIFPDSIIEVYTKQYLHTGEDEYFSSSMDYNPLIKIGDEIVSMAICADINNNLHPQCAKECGSTIYIASIFYSQGGIQEGHDRLKGYAEKFNLDVLMSNYCGSSFDVQAGGRSAFWTKEGELMAECNGFEPGLLLVEKANQNWTSSFVNL